MNMTMEALTPLYGEAVARVLVEALELARVVGPSTNASRAKAGPLVAAIKGLVESDPPERPHLEAIVDHLRGMEPGRTLPEYAVADRVLVLRRAYERHAEMVNDIKIALFETLPDGTSVDDELAGVKLLGRLFRDAKRAVETAKGCTDAVATTLRYQLAQADKRTAHERYNAAGPALDLACVHERLAEVECQADPVRKVIAEDLLGVTPNEGGLPDALYKAVRKACLRVAFYVALGRVPERKGA